MTELVTRKAAARALGITTQRLSQLARSGRIVSVGRLVDLEATRQTVSGRHNERSALIAEIEARRAAGEPMLSTKVELFVDAVARHSDIAAAARFAFVPTSADRRRLEERALVLLAFPAVMQRVAARGVKRDRIRSLRARAVAAGYAREKEEKGLMAQEQTPCEIAAPPPLNELADVARLALDGQISEPVRTIALRALVAGLAAHVRAGRAW